MAVIRDIFCPSCRETKQACCGAGDWPSECSECRQKREAQARHVALEGLKSLSLEDRIARIEAWIYDYRSPVSLSDLRF